MNSIKSTVIAASSYQKIKQFLFFLVNFKKIKLKKPKKIKLKNQKNKTFR